MNIIFENADVLVVNKPAGQVVIPGRNMNNDNVLLKEAETHTGEKIFVVHRIDKDTSGIVLFAKNADTHRMLCTQFEKRTIEKQYLALVQEEFTSNGIINQPIKEFGSGRMGISPEGKPSVTRYKVVAPVNGNTLLEVTPDSGRRHQIRVHLFSIGKPILGDTIYGTVRPVGGASRLMLHANKLTVTIPVEGIKTFQAKRGDDWEEEIEKIRNKK